MELNLEQFLKELDVVTDKTILKAEEGINMIAEDLLLEAQDRAPHDQGDLASSGSVEKANRNSGDIVAKVGFSSEYALRRHEEVYNLGEGSTSKQQANGKKVGRKYLQRAITDNHDKYEDIFLHKLKEATE